jgi:hypothetical protein
MSQRPSVVGSDECGGALGDVQHQRGISATSQQRNVAVSAIRIASNGELKAGYYAAEGRNYLAAGETAELIALNESIAKMLRRWQATLTPNGPRTKDQGRTEDQERTKN